MTEEVKLLKSEVARYRRYFAEIDQKLVEAWDLIDKMTPYLEDAYINFDLIKTNVILAEIQERRSFMVGGSRTSLLRELDDSTEGVS